MNAETAKKIYSRGEEFDSSSLYVLRVLPESRKISLTQKEPVVPIDEATLVSHQQSGVPLKARVTNTTRDGVTVDMGGREGFVPRERLDVYDNEPLWALFDRGDNMLVRVLDITPDSSSSLSLCGRQRFYLPPPDVRAALNQNQSPPRYDPKAPKGSSARFLDSLPGPALSVVLSMLSLGDLTSIFANLSVRMRAEADGAAVRRPEIMAGLRCFFHKKGPLEMGFVKGEKTILGVGISYDRHPKTGMIQDVTSAFDPLSAEAYDIDGVRKGIWKEPFTAFLPLVIDRHHWAAAQRRIEETIMRLGLAEEVDEGSSEDTSGGAAMSLDEYKKFKEARRKAVQARMAARQERIAAAAAAAASSSSSGPAAADAADEIPLPELPQVFKFDPIVTLSVLPQLMNSQVVQLLSGDTHASVKALEGYMATHHLFLQLCHEYPELQAEVDRRTTAFRDRPSSRTKDVTPSLGDFFALLSVTDSTDWAELCEGVVEEVFDRNVLWVLKKYPHLYDPSNDAAGGKERLNRTLQANAVSLRLLCFQVWFLENVAHALHFHFDAATQTYRPCRKAVCSLQRYNRSRGLPPPSLSERLQKETKRLTSLSSWDAFFSGVRMNSPGDRMIARWLRRALLNSLRKGYHRSFPFKREVEEKSRQRTEKKAERNANDYEDDDFGIDTRSGPGAAERRRQRDERQWNQYFNQMMYPTEEGGRGGRGRGQGR
uniref:S1 motif domain-containing protein n=1 Tax=Chromera velia CCMP2878 TaxID=1169474 RepID=A0A0G4HQ10_9ALVE|eukprot:Cvel_7917.t1-p1 / transcript=Cvel_7917.t1 / gene=Cvel_7917 / organism=Chromera_velia_CCMP2878 / gene_product=hypothetical protein / transcript_product=hypothetical protein / location=Cvel_scaffold424:67500-71703(-) / protein_length=712 / sequence_SO=supercontig / SO=protein_coding / is_pseudo=false